MNCPVCYASKDDIVMFPCTHYMCTSCLTSLINSNLDFNCPCCREPIENSYAINSNNFIDKCPKKLPLRIRSEKGTSEPISTEEEQLLKLIFGNFVMMQEEDYSHLYNRIILIQDYKNNSWIIGNLSSYVDRKITLNDCKYISRCDGKVYSTTPSVRNVKVYE